MLVNRAGTAVVIGIAALTSACREVAAPIAAPAAAAVYVRFPTETLFVGQQLRATAVATGADSIAVAWPPFAWTSSDTTVAVVDSAGNVLGLGEGSTIVAAEFDGMRDSIEIRVAVRTISPGTRFARMGVGTNSLCALSVAGAAYCSPQVTDEAPPNFIPKSLPAGVALTSLAIARTHQCGLTAVGEMYCWGTNVNGQFLTGRTVPNEVSGEAVAGGGTRRFVALAVGADDNDVILARHTCGIEVAGLRVVCAGRNGTLQLGHTGPMLDSVVAPTSNALTAQRIASAAYQVCAIDLARALWCWGGSFTDPRSAPRTIASGTQFLEVSLSREKLCALSTGGELWCTIVGGSFAIEGALQREAPGLTFASVLVGATFRRISQFTTTRQVYTCGLTADGALYCWGDFPPITLSRRLGDRRLSPVLVAPGTQFMSIGADRHHLCGVTVDNRLVCF